MLVGEPAAGGDVPDRGVEHGLVAAHKRVVLLEHESLTISCDEILHEGPQASRPGQALVKDPGGVVQVDDDAEPEDGRQDLPAPVVALVGEVQPGLPGQAHPPQSSARWCKVARLDHRGGDEQAVPLALVDEGVPAHSAAAGAGASVGPARWMAR